jgi:hypothetical protein
VAECTTNGIGQIVAEAGFAITHAAQESCVTEETAGCFLFCGNTTFSTLNCTPIATGSSGWRSERTLVHHWLSGGGRSGISHDRNGVSWSVARERMNVFVNLDFLSDTST